DVLPRLPAGEAVRAAAHRMSREAAIQKFRVARGDVLGDERHAPGVESVGVRTDVADDDGPLVRRLHGGDVRELRDPRLRLSRGIADLLPREGDVAGRDGLAVVPDDAVAKVER